MWQELFFCSRLNIALKGELFLNFLTFGNPSELFMARACVVALMVFGVTFHIAQGMDDDRLFGLFLLWHFDAIIDFDSSSVQLSHKFHELNEGRFGCDWIIFILSDPFFPFPFDRFLSYRSGHLQNRL